MSLIEILASLNKIGLVSFFITLTFLIYEVTLLRKAKKAKDQPEVPQFQEGGKSLTPAQTIIRQEKANWQELLANNNKIIFIILSVLLFIFAVISVAGLINSSLKKSKTTASVPNPIPSRTPAGLSPTSAQEEDVFENLLAQSEESPTPSEEAALISQDGGEQPVESPTPNESSAEAELSDDSPSSPTGISSLPITSNFSNMLVLFTAAGIFILFSFLF